VLTYVKALTTTGLSAEEAAEQATANLKLHGYAGAAVRPLVAGVTASPAALAVVGRAARARGELVVPERGV
jgi:hypothetical protein